MSQPNPASETPQPATTELDGQPLVATEEDARQAGIDPAEFFRSLQSALEAKAAKAEADGSIVGAVQASELRKWENAFGKVHKIYFAIDEDGEELGVAYLRAPTLETMLSALDAGAGPRGAEAVLLKSTNWPGGCLLNSEQLGTALKEPRVRVSVAMQASKLLQFTIAVLQGK